MKSRRRNGGMYERAEKRAEQSEDFGNKYRWDNQYGSFR